MKIIKPFVGNYPVTQTFDEHVARAKANGWCYNPGPCASGIYYYGGEDYGMPIGTGLIAAHDADLTQEKQNGGYGWDVRLKWQSHGDTYEIIYGHLSAFVGYPRSVKQGELIAYSGNTGNSTGPHLHFEYRINGKPINPRCWYAESTSPEPPPEIPALPALPEMVWGTALGTMNLRDNPGIDSNVIGRVNLGERYEVLEYIVDGKDLWMKIGQKQYVAGMYQGVVYVKFE